MLIPVGTIKQLSCTRFSVYSLLEIVS